MIFRSRFLPGAKSNRSSNLRSLSPQRCCVMKWFELNSAVFGRSVDSYHELKHDDNWQVSSSVVEKELFPKLK